MDASDHSNMFSVIHKLNRDVVDVYIGYSFCIVNKKFLVWSRKYHKFCLFWGKSDMVGSAVVKGEIEEVFQEGKITGKEDDIISLAY